MSEVLVLHKKTFDYRTFYVTHIYLNVLMRISLKELMHNNILLMLKPFFFFWEDGRLHSSATHQTLCYFAAQQEMV